MSRVRCPSPDIPSTADQRMLTPHTIHVSAPHWPKRIGRTEQDEPARVFAIEKFLEERKARIANA